MHKRRRIVLLFGFGIVLPSVLLGYLAFRGVQNDRALVEKERAEETRRTADRVVAALTGLALLERVEAVGDEIVVSVADGAAAISPVAVALAKAGITVEGLTLRTPTLDDVFLHITGGRLQEDAV